MKLSVFGLGYVGAVSAGCFAREGHQVIGVDSVQSKVDVINAGHSPIIEAELDAILSESVANGRLTATTDVLEAVRNTDISLICVGTPSMPNGALDLNFMRRVCEQIGIALKDKDAYHVIVIRSTVLPGSIRNVVIPVLEESSGRRAGVDFGICMNPEFLREGTAVFDFGNPPKTVIGELDSRSGDAVAELYSNVDAHPIRTDLDTAELVKYTDNVWHALKVCFANEVGNVAKAVGVDSHKVMDIFCRDTKLNLSPYYMKPGFAFGGSCLPKDVRAFSYLGRKLDLNLPVINSILASNESQVKCGLRLVLDHARCNLNASPNGPSSSRQPCSSKGCLTSRCNIGVLGMSFKAGTDDLRESPIVEIIETLLGKGHDVRIYDRNVRLAGLIGSNRDHILNRIPHIARLMTQNVDDVIRFANTIVIGNNDPEFQGIQERLHPGQVLVDFVRIKETSSGTPYEGICW